MRFGWKRNVGGGADGWSSTSAWTLERNSEPAWFSPGWWCVQRKRGMVVNIGAAGGRRQLRKWLHSVSLAGDSGSRSAAIEEVVEAQLCRHLNGNKRRRW
jgi:hypothetical protein